MPDKTTTKKISQIRQMKDLADLLFSVFLEGHSVFFSISMFSGST